MSTVKYDIRLTGEVHPHASEEIYKLTVKVEEIATKEKAVQIRQAINKVMEQEELEQPTLD